MSQFTTGEVAKLCGVTVRTVQYYDNRGILSPTALSEGGRRLYSDRDVATMKKICFLRELGMPLGTIAKLLREENSEEVISLVLEEQQKALESEIEEREGQLARLNELRGALERSDDFSLETIHDVAHTMENKKKLKKIHATLLLTGIPVTAFQWVSIALWIALGIWWPFVVWAATAVVYGTLGSIWYFKSVAYVCPECHEVFEPRFREAFFANHTPRTRKLTCKCCGHRGFCVETAKKK